MTVWVVTRDSGGVPATPFGKAPLEAQLAYLANVPWRLLRAAWARRGESPALRQWAMDKAIEKGARAQAGGYYDTQREAERIVAYVARREGVR